MDGWINGWMDGWIWIVGSMDDCTDGQMDGGMHQQIMDDWIDSLMRLMEVYINRQII